MLEILLGICSIIGAFIFLVTKVVFYGFGICMGVMILAEILNFTLKLPKLIAAKIRCWRK